MKFELRGLDPIDICKCGHTELHHEVTFKALMFVPIGTTHGACRTCKCPEGLIQKMED